MKKLKVFEAFAGYGGASYGLKRSKIEFEVVGFSEIDKFGLATVKVNISSYQKSSKLIL